MLNLNQFVKVYFLVVCGKIKKKNKATSSVLIDAEINWIKDRNLLKNKVSD